MRHMLARFLPAILLGSFCSISFADLSESINHVLQSQHQGEVIGVYVENIEPGTVLYSYNGTLPMTPASTTKAFTAAAAYLSLGPNYHYETTLSTAAFSVPLWHSRPSRLSRRLHPQRG